MRQARISRLDIAVVALLGAIIGAWLAATLGGRDAAGLAQVHVDGEAVLSVALDQDAEYPVQGPQGESRLTVQDGRLRINEAPCPRRLCMRRGWLEQHGDSVTCVPNRVYVRLEGNERGYDSLNF